MQNTLILAYRNRPDHLRLFLAALKDALAQAKQDHQLLIVDLASTPRQTEEIIEAAGIPVELHRIEYTGPFLRSKALNYGVRNSTSELVTVLDVDCLLCPDFFTGLEEHFSTSQSKLSYNVRYLDLHTSKLIRQQGIQFARGNVFARADRHPFCWNVYKDGRLIGNSMFTMTRADFLKIGGFNEWFGGHGWEDVEFNMRCWNARGPTTLHPTSIMFHLYHGESQPGWNEAGRQNQHLYQTLGEQGFPNPEIEEDWGVFEEDEHATTNLMGSAEQ